jgi:hypothetical protein
MQALVWWLVPLAAFLLALAWVSVRNRPRPPADPHESMAEHERFRQAMQSPVDRRPARTKRRFRRDAPADASPGRPPGGQPGADGDDDQTGR